MVTLRHDLGAQMASHFGAMREDLATRFEVMVEWMQATFVRRDELADLLRR